MRLAGRILLAVLVIGGLGALYYWFTRPASARDARVTEWIRSPKTHPEWKIPAGTRCSAAPFIFPTTGYIGYLWADSFYPGHNHTGIDIFGGEAPGRVPVIAAASGYLARLPDWKSTVIIRIPSDPLQPGRQIWTYYTHLADPEGNSLVAAQFPPGTSEVFVAAGTPLGMQGNFSGTPGKPVGVHLHFSILLSDSQGSFTNESLLANTLDPSPYLGLPLNARTAKDQVVTCPE